MATTDAPTAAAPAAAVASPRGRSFAPRYPGWLTAPSLLYYLAFFIGPMALLVVFAFGKPPTTFGSLVHYGFSSDQYRQVWSSINLTVFWHTMAMAAGGSALTILVGYPLAYWMARYLTIYKPLALLLVVVPFWTSFLIRTLSLKIIFDSGGFLSHHGIDWLYSWKAIQVGLVYNYLPLLVLPVYAALERMDWTLVEAATDLGASPFKAFREITLPLTLPGLITGALLVFIPMCGEYVIPDILGGGKFEFVGSLIGSNFITALNAPYGAALAVVLMLVLSVFVVIYIAFATREEQFGA